MIPLAVVGLAFIILTARDLIRGDYTLSDMTKGKLVWNQVKN